MHPPAWWPLPDGEEIGEERARELVRWLRTVAPAAVEAATVQLRERAPGAEVHTYAVSAKSLATQALATQRDDWSAEAPGSPTTHAEVTSGPGNTRAFRPRACCVRPDRESGL